jgi:hypothetical protein
VPIYTPDKCYPLSKKQYNFYHGVFPLPTVSGSLQILSLEKGQCVLNILAFIKINSDHMGSG